MVKDVETLRQLGGWLRSSHSLKECVIAHQSSGFAPIMTGTQACHRSQGCGHFYGSVLRGRGALPEHRSGAVRLPVERRQVRMPE